MPEPLIYCSFCDKSQHEVQTVIARANVYICNDCVAVCNAILRHVGQPDAGCAHCCASQTVGARKTVCLGFAAL